MLMNNATPEITYKQHEYHFLWDIVTLLELLKMKKFKKDFSSSQNTQSSEREIACPAYKF